MQAFAQNMQRCALIFATLPTYLLHGLAAYMFEKWPDIICSLKMLVEPAIHIGSI